MPKRTSGSRLLFASVSIASGEEKHVFILQDE